MSREAIFDLNSWFLGDNLNPIACVSVRSYCEDVFSGIAVHVQGDAGCWGLVVNEDYAFPDDVDSVS